MSPQKFNWAGNLVATAMTSQPVWPTVQATPARSGYHSTEQVPTQPLMCNWTFDTTTTADDVVGVRGIGNASPVIGTELLYFANDAGNVYALDIETGEQRWRYTNSDPVHSVSSPTQAGNTLFVGIDDKLHALAADTGARKWAATIGDGAIDGSPTVVGDIVVAQSEQVHGIDRETGTIEWTVETNGGRQSVLAAMDKMVYVVDTTQLHAIDGTDGSTKWMTELDCELSTSPVVSDTTVFVGGEDGTLTAIEADSGQTNWRVDVGTEIEASPAVANGTIYIGTAGVFDGKNNLYAIDAADGTIEWTFGDTLEPIRSAPVVADNTVLTGYSGQLFALAADTGEKRWSVKLRGTSLSSPAFAHGTVFVESNNQYLYALSTDRDL